VAACTPSTFSSLPLFGAEILHKTATPVTNYTQTIPSSTRYVQPPITVTNASFCNVTITYTHPGLNDTLAAEIWLPSEAGSWNGRLQSVGGGGWTAGRYEPSYARMAGAIYEGYVAATTDGGIVPGAGPEVWGLVSEGNLNTVALENFGERSLGDLVWMARPTSPFCCFFLCLFVFFDLVVLTTHAILGRPRQGRHPRILRPRPSLLVLDWLLQRRPTSQYSSAGVSVRIRRGPRGCSGTALAANRHHASVAIILHGPDETVPAKVRDAGVDNVRD
jgi:hypothetical protein